MTRTAALTRTGVSVGTPEYMAPEQVRGVRDITPAADVFALGCVLYECLAGTPPFTAEHLTAVLVRILFEAPTPLGLRRPGIPNAVEELILRTLQKDPALRIADAAALRVELDRLVGLAEPPPAARAVAAESRFASSEQALITVVVAAPEPSSELASETARAGALPEPRRRASLLEVARSLGAVADFLLGETLVATIVQPGSATDQVNLAARLALLVKERWPEAQVAVATGRGTTNGAAAFGEVADRASALLRQKGRRIRGAGTGSGVWIDELSVRLLGSAFALRPADGATLVIGEEREADASRPLLGRPTPCVGRDAELGNLEGQLNSCVEEGEARAVLITAPPGVGKSRLRHEFLRRIAKRAEPLTLLIGRGDVMSASSGAGILGLGIRHLCGIGGKEPIPEQQQRLRERVGRNLRGADRERTLLFLGELAGLPPEGEGESVLQAARKDPRLMREQLRRAFVEWITAEAEAGLALIVLDDLQWGDALSVSLLDHALREVSGKPLFLLAFARPEIHDVFPRIWSTHRLQEVPLKGLSRKACERLIQQILGSRLSADEIARVVQQAGGNALFLEEIIRSIAEGKAAEQPETVVALLQGRIGRLGAGARRTVRAAAVFGQTFWSSGVAALLGIPREDPDLQEWLQALLDAELIQPAQVRNEPTFVEEAHEREYIFRHALVRDAAYGLLTESDLALGHRLAGVHLEARGTTDAAIIAEHHRLGGDAPRAARFYLVAAERCLERGSHADALRHTRGALSCAPDAETLSQLRSIESVAALWSNDFDRIVASADTLQSLRPGSTGWYRALLGRCVALYSAQQEEGACELVRVFLQNEPDAAHVTLYMETASTLIRLVAWFESGSLVQSLENKLESCVRQVESASPTSLRFLVFSRAVIAYYRRPRIWQMILDLQRTIELSRQARDVRFELGAQAARLELAWLELGDGVGAEQRLLAIEPLLQQQQDALLGVYWRLSMARILCERSDEAAFAQAEELIKPVLDNRSGFFHLLATAQAIRARIALRRGDLVRAGEHATEAFASFSRAPLHLLDAAAFLTRVLLVQGQVARALATVEQVRETVRRFECLGICEVDWRAAAAEAFHAAGEPAAARAELIEAMRQMMLRADDITEPVWRTSYLTRNPACRQLRELARQWGIEVTPGSR